MLAHPEHEIGHDRVVGCLIGGAIGDGWGSCYEGTVPPVRIDDSREWVLSDDAQLSEHVPQLATLRGPNFAEECRYGPYRGETFRLFFRLGSIGLPDLAPKSQYLIKFGVVFE
jgi:hypothetical protein